MYAPTDFVRIEPYSKVLNAAHLMYVKLAILTHRIFLTAAQVTHVVVDVDVGGRRLAPESFDCEGHAPLSPPPCRATLGVNVLFDAMPVVLCYAKPVNQVT